MTADRRSELTDVSPAAFSGLVLAGGVVILTGAAPGGFRAAASLKASHRDRIFTDNTQGLKIDERRD